MKWQANIAITDDKAITVLSESILFDLTPEMTYNEKIYIACRQFTYEQRIRTYLRASLKAFLPWEHAELEFVADLGGWLHPTS